MKRAFTLIELTFTIVLVAVLSGVAIKAQQYRDYLEDIDNMYKTINLIVDEAIYDNNYGYTQDTGGDCSDSYDVKDITAGRVFLCRDYSGSAFDITPNPPVSTDKNGANSYFTFLREYSSSNYGCRLYIDNITDFQTSLFLKCKDMDNLYKIENGFASYAKKHLPTLFVDAYFNATSPSNTTGGSSSDGMVRLDFKK